MISWKQTWVILGLIFCVGVGLRGYDLGKNSLVADEFLDMNSAYGYFKTGQWQAWDFNLEQVSNVNLNVARDERANIYKWQVAQLFRFLPPTEATARAISVLWGGVTILVVFWSALVFTRSREVALLSALLFALSVAGLIFDRRLRMYAMFAPVYMALATIVYLALEKTVGKRLRAFGNISRKMGVHLGYALAALGLLAIGLLTHQLTAAIVFPVAVYLGWASVEAYRRTGLWRNRYSVLLMLGVLGLLVMRLSAPSFFASFSAGLIFLDNHYSYLEYVMRDYAHPLWAVFLMGFGVYHLAVRERQLHATWYLLFSFVIPLACAIWFFRRNAGAQYIFFAQSFGLVLSAAGLIGVWQVLRAHFPLWNRRVAGIVLAGLILLTPNLGYFLEENNTYHETSSGDNPNYRKVFDFFQKNRQPGDVLITRNFRNYYWSGAQVKVFDLGDEINQTKLSIAALDRIMTEHESGWVILSSNDYDYVSHEAEAYMKMRLERVSNASVRGPIDVYRFGKTENK